MRLPLFAALCTVLLLPGTVFAEQPTPKTAEELDESYAQFMDDCISPWEEKERVAYEEYEEALYSGKLGQADHAKKTMQILADLRMAELAHKDAKWECKEKGIEYLKEVESKVIEEILNGLEEIVEEPTVTCLVNGKATPCEKAEDDAGEMGVPSSHDTPA